MFCACLSRQFLFVLPHVTAAYPDASLLRKEDFTKEPIPLANNFLAFALSGMMGDLWGGLGMSGSLVLQGRLKQP